MRGLPEYLHIPPEERGAKSEGSVHLCTDRATLAAEMAEAICQCIREAGEAGRKPTLIVGVGPVDQFPYVAQKVNAERLDLRDVCFINMDEYLTDDDQWVSLKHPLSFRGFMNRQFYDRLDSALAPLDENRVFPDPTSLQSVGRIIEERGGIDATFGGIGINGHIAFNEPPELGDDCDLQGFASRETRVLELARETRTINAVTVGGEIGIVPRRCVTVGMREILSSLRLHFYCNRPWQSAVVRRVLHDPLTPDCPASLLRMHQDATLTVTEEVAALPDIRLR